MNSLKQVIVTAVIKVSSDPIYSGKEYATPEEARGDFIRALIAELFPECPTFVLPSAVHASESVGVGVETKKRAPKVKKETPVAAEAPVPEPMTAEAPVAEPGKETKKKAPKVKKETPTGEAVAEPVKEKKKSGPKPKGLPEGPFNLEKLNPTQTKKLKSIGEELKVEVNKKTFQEFLNSLSKEDYDAKTFDEHARSFLTPPAAPVAEPEFTKCARVEWPEDSGVTYLVDPETQRVYLPCGDVNEYVGDVGMLEFEGLVLPAA